MDVGTTITMIYVIVHWYAVGPLNVYISLVTPRVSVNLIDNTYMTYVRFLTCFYYHVPYMRRPGYAVHYSYFLHSEGLMGVSSLS